MSKTNADTSTETRAKSRRGTRTGARKTARIDPHRFGPWAVVTGASSGIGQEFARQLAANGINLVLVSRRGPMLEQVGQALERDYGVSFRALEIDLSEADAHERIAAATEDLDVGLLVSNAGTGRPGNFLSFDRADLQMIAQLNGLSYLMLTHLFGQRFKRRGRGGVLLISALGADEGVPYNTPAAASKALVSTLGRSLHSEFRPLGIDVSVLVVTPTATPIIEKMGLALSDLPMRPMPVWQCVHEGLEGLRRNRMIVMPGRFNRVMSALMPAGVARTMSGKLMLKSRTFVT